MQILNDITFTLHFGGFYESYLSHLIDSELEQTLEESSHEYLNISNGRHVTTELAKAYLDNYPEAIDSHARTITSFDLEFLGLDSPRFYNFETDSIKARIKFKDLKTLLRQVYEELGRENLIAFINENSKSYDGFHSFYEGFEAVKADLSIFLQYLFRFINSELEIGQPQVIEEGNLHELVANELEYEELA